MNKKKVIFVTEKLIMGGVEKSLLEWIKILAPYMEITVAVMHLGGELETEIGKQEGHAAVLLHHDRETPDVAHTNRRTDTCQNESPLTLETISLF